MSSFDPRTLDASIHDVVFNLNDTQKVDVLLHALQHLPIQGCRTVMENAVQSLLQVPDLSPTNGARALLLRTKYRDAAGYHASTEQDPRSALTMDPENYDAKAIVQSQHVRPLTLFRGPACPPRFSKEVWREIALFLPRRDLKTLLLVSNTLSCIASQLLFREIDLHLTAPLEPVDLETTQGNIDQDFNTWHLRRSADILTRILIDPHFAGQIRGLRIFALSLDNTQNLIFQVGMLMNSLSKLSNLCKVHFSGGNPELITNVLKTVHSYHPCLQRLSLIVVGDHVDLEIPVFKHLAHFSIGTDDDIIAYPSIQAFLAQSRDTLRSLSIKNPLWHFPAEVISVRHLTQIEFQGCFSLDAQAFSEILVNGHQLESLMLSGTLACMPSVLFRQHRTALPFLRHFALKITDLPQHITDRELCPAISDFVRERTQLQTYCLLVPPDARRIGFDASAWGVLPALSKLTNLTLTYSPSLSASLAGWLVPRTVRALTLDMAHMVTKDLVAIMNKLRTGMPPQLRYIGITGKADHPVLSTVEHEFPNVRVVQIDGRVWTVTRSGEDGSVGVEEWPYQKVTYHAAEWLEALECTDTAVWWGSEGELL